MSNNIIKAIKIKDGHGDGAIPEWKRLQSLRGYKKLFKSSVIADLILGSERGSLTLESAIVMPIVIFIACMMVYIVLLLFEHAQLQSSADYAAHRAAMAWRGAVIEENGANAIGGTNALGTAQPMGEAQAVGTAQPMGAAQAIGTLQSAGAARAPISLLPDWSAARYAGLYGRLYDFNRAYKLEAAYTIAGFRFNNIKIPGYTSAAGVSEYQNTLLSKNIIVGMQGKTYLPSCNVTSVFGFGNVAGGDFYARSLAPDFAENIRTVDYVFEIEQKIEEKSPEFAAVANEFKDILDKITEYINGLAR